jgi:sec-independent protein translocase protein TatB
VEFLGVGPAELVVILVVALVFVGPERLPKLAADIARTIREIRKYTGSLAAEFNEVIKDFENDTEGERSTWKEIGDGLTGATKSITEAVRGAHVDARGVRAPTPAPASVPESVAPTSNDASAAPPTTQWREIPTTAPDSHADHAPLANRTDVEASPVAGSSERSK